MSPSLELKVPLKLKPFLTKKKRYKIAFGGRGAAKSMTIADILAHRVQMEGILIGCLREFQNSLDDSVYALLKSEIKKLEIPGFQVKKSYIDHLAGGGFRFRGLARSIEAIKSMFGFKIFWLEEGQFISEDSLKILTPTLRESGSELWISANPLNSADPFSQRFIVPYQKDLDKYGFYEDDRHYIVKINWRDNPWFPQVLEEERIHDLETLPRALYDHIWEGAFNDSVENSIIRTEWFDAAVNAHEKLGIKPRGATVLSHDPSDLGTDEKGLALRKGNLILEAVSRKFGDVNSGADWALDKAVEEGVDLFTWDADGMGLGLRRQVSEALLVKKIQFQEFHGGGAVLHPEKKYIAPHKAEGRKKSRKNKEVFRNRRAQQYWDLRDRFMKTYLAVEKGRYINPKEMIFISPEISDLQLLRSEVCRIPRVYNGKGMIQIMSKIDMLNKLKIQSPNVADSVMMCLSKPKLQLNDKPMKFETVY